MPRRPDLDGRVELRGRVEDPRPVLEGASVLLHCADREPFGIAMIEALAAGVPVVAPASGGPTEIVTKACGRLYPPGAAAAAAQGLARVPGPAGDARGSPRAGGGVRRHSDARGVARSGRGCIATAEVKSFFAVPDSGTAKKGLTSPT